MLTFDMTFLFENRTRVLCVYDWLCNCVNVSISVPSSALFRDCYSNWGDKGCEIDM